MEVGTYSNNTQRLINLNEIYNNLGASVCAALPAFHAFIGCDYTASFFGKGTAKPFTILKKQPEISKAFSKFGGSEEISSEVVTKLKDLCVFCIINQGVGILIKPVLIPSLKCIRINQQKIHWKERNFFIPIFFLHVMQF